MPLSSAQICTMAQTIARVPGFGTIAGQWLNIILSDLCETYDFDLAKGQFNFNFNPGLTDTINGMIVYGGPYPLPADYLRAVDENSVFWYLTGVPYMLIPVDLSEFDQQVQQQGTQSYPYLYATDMSQTPPVMWVYSPPDGAYPVTVRYRRQMPDIPSPQLSAATPWFPNQQYLITKLSAQLMKVSNDPRWESFEGSADDILRRYLKLKDDSESRAKSVKLDRRRFGSNFGSLSNTKTIGF